MNYYLEVLRKYADFSGRSRRAEYWYFFLFNLLIQIVIQLSNLVIGKNVAGALIIVYAIILIVPSIAVAVRRLHDTGRSGWWILIGLIPVVGGIWGIVLMCLDSNPGDNKYGPNPKNVPASPVPPAAPAPTV